MLTAACTIHPAAWRLPAPGPGLEHSRQCGAGARINAAPQRLNNGRTGGRPDGEIGLPEAPAPTPWPLCSTRTRRACRTIRLARPFVADPAAASGAYAFAVPGQACGGKSGRPRLSAVMAAAVRWGGGELGQRDFSPEPACRAVGRALSV